MRLAVTLLVIAACARSVPARNAPAPLPFSYQIDAPAQYATWLVEVQVCALAAAQVDTTFRVEYLVGDVTGIVWRAVPTEREDGRFPWNEKLYGGLRTGPVGEADTILLSGQLLWSRRLVKHELLHILVASPTEGRALDHGRPWGFCEYQD